MANLVLQDDMGTVDGANAYIDVATFKSYHDARNNSYIDPNTAVAFTDDKIAGAIVRATSYLDERFEFVGFRRYVEQTTQWPRWDAVDSNDRYLRGIPLPVQWATAEYALRALSISLLPDPTQDGTGRVVKSKRVQVGTIIEGTEYEGGAYQLPRYPTADRMLISRGLVLRGGTTTRA